MRCISGGVERLQAPAAGLQKMQKENGGEMTVKDIVIKYLKDNGFDGLCYEDCGCDIDDLAPCWNNYEDCQPAYKHVCMPELRKDLIYLKGECPLDCTGECYRLNKPEAK